MANPSRVTVITQTYDDTPSKLSEINVIIEVTHQFGIDKQDNAPMLNIISSLIKFLGLIFCKKIFMPKLDMK